MVFPRMGRKTTESYQTGQNLHVSGQKICIALSYPRCGVVKIPPKFHHRIKKGAGCSVNIFLYQKLYCA